MKVVPWCADGRMVGMLGREDTVTCTGMDRMGTGWREVAWAGKPFLEASQENLQ